MPLLYKENRDNYKIFSFTKFILKLIKGILISLIIFSFDLLKELLQYGRNKDIWYMSLKTYICILIIVSGNLILYNNYITFLLPLSIVLTTFFLFGIFLIINHYGVFFIFNSKASIELTFRSLLTYLHIFVICSFSFIIDYSTRLFNIYFSRSLSSRLILKKAMKSDRKSFYRINKLLNSKSYSKPSKKRIQKKITPFFDDKSKSNLKLKPPNEHINNNIDYEDINTPKAFNNSKYKVGPDYKNNFFSLRLINLNKKRNDINEKIDDKDDNNGSNENSDKNNNKNNNINFEISCNGNNYENKQIKDS